MMLPLLLLSLTIFLLLTGFLISPSIMLLIIGLLASLFLVLLSLVFVPYFTELILSDNRPPVVGPITNQLFHFQTLYHYMTSLAKKHHTFRFITPTHSEVYTADPVNVEYILKTNFANYDKGDHNIGIMEDLFGEGIFTVDGHKWRHQRKLASFEFSTRNLRDFSSAIFRSNGAKLAKKISLLAAAKETMNLQDLLLRSTFDSIFKVGFGFDLDTLSGLDEASNRFMKAFDEANSLTFWRFVDLLWRVKRYFNIGSEAELKKNIRMVDEFVYELIRNKREQMKDTNIHRNKEDILSRFLIESEKDPGNMTDKYLRDISLSFVIAGKDTSANTLAWFFYMLCKHPLIQQKIADEVKTATEADDDTSMDEFGLRLTDAALEKMHYLHAALSETLRLYPAVPLDGKSAVKDDVLPDGPERWLNNGVFQLESPFKFTAFQGGPRICLGKEFAYRQMKILAAFLVYFFKFKLADESKEVMYRTMFTLHMDKGLHFSACKVSTYHSALIGVLYFYLYSWICVNSVQNSSAPYVFASCVGVIFWSQTASLCDPDGLKIKKGDGVAYIAYPMGMMTYIWGDGAEEFRPERWFNNGVFRPESPFKFTAFQGGPRICLGKEFAYRQMKTLAAFLAYFFMLKPVEESKEATYRTMFTLHMDKGLHFHAFHRI
ncbi:hypothetical protein M8C21_028623 [Ambrosia artemisiifolia]|uniref:Cytochrome P450 704C1-like protein n=1 Tax=Ambrosia artemisiifolia TaxID=4212 RepID=A0AAD5BTF4_AMBAR|nr:hypothetical protein M8C21_028623 [Ambrosia artemisiifolia]